ncbi:acyl-CoA ligase (AMP-forming), exosortase A system-associated [Pseudorhodoferax sp. Leaf267]|uniref:acyl-CoA ligase (AMP-forming), exosortase A system-associated n=1 Tax=Pseudorhodoferax sp. Leaf267 TaxID=1736316 RepID=UPI0007005679|nr:acyl-CoA ligase (AMP-forming), exosortase A system-associated [Pseudorhodoferax sp. Leaf267]KQP23139.1 acyl--CoA ligase [Pseudorhodoferax sp. Leaf267]
MSPTRLLDTLLFEAAATAPQACALVDGAQRHSYESLAHEVDSLAAALIAQGLPRAARVAIYLENRRECVVAAFAAARAGLVFVPINAVLKTAQVQQILQDSGAAVLISSGARLQALGTTLWQACPAVQAVWLVDPASGALAGAPPAAHWPELARTPARAGHRVLDSDMAAILYTSGSTGRAKGVVLSHRNLVLGATSVASYLDNRAGDRLLAALPLSFDAGFSQLTTAFHARACVVLHNYLLPRDLLATMAHERITGLTAVPSLYIQLAQLDLPAASAAALRYFANTGGRMPRQTLQRLRQWAPAAKPFLMYGLTEAFRSTYLPPEQVDLRPDSIGRAIPNAEILVLRADGSLADDDEPGELVHRGPLVAQGYWRDPVRTAERYRPLPPGLPGSVAGLPLPELAVYSGDTVRRDADGYLYFIGRRDEMIKSSGYRISPTEVEEVLYGTGLVGECAAFGAAHGTLGQSVQVVATAPGDAAALDVAALLAACRARMPGYMVPAAIEPLAGPLPRNPNGKIDRQRLAAEWATRHAAKDLEPS